MNYNQAVQQVISISPSVGGGGGVSNIATLTPVSDIVVPYRTAFGANGVTVGLPASVSCTFDGGGNGTVDMTWAIGSYDPGGTTGSLVAFYSDAVYNIVGTPVETGSITNTGNITDTVQITVRTPWFPLTATTKIIYDFTKLQNNTTNDYGTVSSGSITLIKSVAPGLTGINLISIGTSPQLSSNRAVFAANGCFEQSAATTDLDFLSYKATQNNLKWTAVLPSNITDSNVNENALFGNNGFSFSNNGISVWLNCSGSNNLFAVFIVGNSVEAIGWSASGMAVTGTDHVYALQLDHALAAGSGKVKGFKGTTQYDATSTGANTLDIVPANPKFQIGGMGGAQRLTGNMAMAIFLDGVDTDAVRNKFVQDVGAYTGIAVS